MSIQTKSRSIASSREALLENLINLKLGQAMMRIYDRLDADELELLVELARAKSISVTAVEHCHTTMLEIRKLPH